MGGSSRCLPLWTNCPKMFVVLLYSISSFVRAHVSSFYISSDDGDCFDYFMYDADHRSPVG